MQKIKTFPMASHLRTLFVVLSGMLLLTGCGSDEKKEEKADDDKKPPYERVVILKERFDQLETSLDEMERDLEIQKKRIEKTRETAKAVKRSLLKGNLKGYSIDTVSTDPVVVAALEKRKEKDKDNEVEEADQEESENFLLNTLLMIAFVILLIAIFWVALRDRNQTPPFDLSHGDHPVPPSDGPMGSPHNPIDELTPNTDTSTYGDLGRPREGDTPHTEPGDEEPRQ